MKLLATIAVVKRRTASACAKGHEKWIAGMALTASCAAGPVFAAAPAHEGCARVGSAPRAANQLTIGKDRILLADASVPNDRLRDAIRHFGATGAIRLLAEPGAPAGAASLSSGLSAGVLDVVVTKVPGSSALFSFPSEDVRYAAVQLNGVQVQIVASVLGAQVLPLAAVASDGERNSDLVWFASPSTAGPKAQLQALERLYQLAFQERPDQRFWLRRHDEASLRTRTRADTQGGALRTLAGLRGCAVAAYEREVRGSNLRRWASVQMTFDAGAKPPATKVAVRTTDERGRLIRHGSVTIARGAHLACTARIEASGLATCKLFDTHGSHDGDAHDDHDGPTIATYSGHLGEEQILLPTTELVGAPGRAGGRNR